MAGALEGLRVLDLSWGIAGPLGVLLLAEQGADVIKVEPPGGDPYRAMPGAHVWNRSRRSVEIDLRTEGGRSRFLELLATADVLVESFSPGTMDAWGLGHDDLAPVFPRLVYCSITAYPAGHRAAGRAGYDALVQARSGQQYAQPGWRPGPIHLHFPAPSMGTCFLATIGILAALVAREETGKGQRVETSLYQGVLVYTTQIWQHLERATPPMRLMMGKSYPPGIHQGSIFECAGGEWIHAATMSGGVPSRTVEDILGLAAVDPMALWSDPAAAAAHRSTLRRSFLGRDRTELVEAFHAAGLGAEPIVPMESAFSHPQLVANGMVVDVDDPLLGPTRQIGVPVVLDKTPGAVRGPQPLVGADTDAVFADLAGGGHHPTPADPATSRSEAMAGPLAGVKVLDLGQFLAGPFAAMILAELGADVIKVEPVRGDAMRQAAMPFLGCQRGKRCLAVDLKSEEGREIVLRMVEQVDVVHHNMTKGTAARLGIDEAALRARNPALIHCNTYAYGPEGPMSGFGGLDPLYQAACGLEYEAGAVAQGGEPLYLRFGMTDTANALVSVVGVLAALYHRRVSGEGQDVWTSLLNGAAVFGSEVLLTPEGPGPRRPGLDRDQTGLSPCYRLYPAQEGWVQVAAVTQAQWRALCQVLGVTHLADDATCASFATRVANRADVEPVLAAAFRTRTATTWVHLLDAAAVPAEVAIDTNDGELVLFDADNERLGLVADMDHPKVGRLRQFGRLWAFSDTPPGSPVPPPLAGQHSREILTTLGFGAAAVDDLVARGVVYEPNDGYAWSV